MNDFNKFSCRNFIYKKQHPSIMFLSEDAVTKITNAKYCYAKNLHQQIKQYIFLLCLLSDHELLDCFLHMFVLRILVILSYNFHKLLLNILKKYAKSDSNRYCQGLKPCASADWATGA